MASPIIINPDPVGQSKDSSDARVPEATHGGFRNNVHFNAYEALADETDMGRDVLRRTDPYSDGELLTQDKYNTVKNAWGARGSSEKYTVSPWAKK